MELIDDLFYVKKGKGAYREQLETGHTPLVSATLTNNGIIDHVDIEPTFKAPAITVERVTGNAFVQLFDFATVPDDISVLVSKEKMNLDKLFFVASQINIRKWKFNYARKATPPRIKEIPINMSDYKKTELNLEAKCPTKKEKTVLTHNQNFKLFNITRFFTINKGDFHALDKLDEGNFPTVSRIDDDNGITGYYEKPENAKVYSKGLITISTVTGDAFIQLDDFIATDNVLICKPKQNLKQTTLFFIQLMLHKQKWRFSYGRQPYKRIFSKTQIYLPVIDNTDELDEDYMEKIVTNCYGWELIEKTLQN